MGAFIYKEYSMLEYTLEDNELMRRKRMKPTLFGKSAFLALLALILAGTAIGCSGMPRTEKPAVQGTAATGPADKTACAKDQPQDRQVVVAIGLEDIASRLANARGGATSDNPVLLTLAAGLADGGWEAVLSAVDAAGKYVALDLSGCAMAGAEFVPGAGSAAGKIVTLVLPDAAKSVPAGTSFNPAFKAFASLRFISGANVEMAGGYAFSGCASLTSVSLPSAVDIGDYAFSGCAGLSSVSLPVAARIGEWAFSGCRSLAETSLPAATDIGGYAFSNCASLTSVSLPVAAYIGWQAFYGCANLRSIRVDPANTAFSTRGGMLLDKAGTTLIAYPSATGDITLPSITAVGHDAFHGCASLTSVSLPAAASIGYDAFQDCASLTSVSLPVAADIGSSAFQDCASLASVSLPTATVIDRRAFSGCVSLTEASLPAATRIDALAFSGCTSLASVALPAAQTIGGSAFYGCASLTEASLPAATDIGAIAFSGCTSLASVSLPAVLTLGSQVFSDCANLTSVSLPATPPSLNADDPRIFISTGSTGAITVAVPTGKVSAYTSEWGVDADTPAYGNEYIYGFYHKAVLITDAAQ
jgi:hypothetical protein